MMDTAATEILKPTAVARRVGVSLRTVMRAIIAGELEASQLSQRGCWRIRECAIDEWLISRSNRTRTPPRLGRVTPVAPGAVAAKRVRELRQAERGQLTVPPAAGRP